jgi:tRNA1Val (adenine37-N6)-methyltransferase
MYFMSKCKGTKKNDIHLSFAGNNRAFRGDFVFYFVLLHSKMRFLSNMAGKSFQFKEFTVQQDMCAMKVGTDAVLLGAWAQLKDACRVLDVGTGTGVIALMCACRLAKTSSGFSIDAIDLDAPAVQQATANVVASPWGDKVRVMQADINLFGEGDAVYDTILSNPPYYRNSPASRNAARDMARCCGTLTYSQLAKASVRLLRNGGTLQVVLPIEAHEEMIASCALCGLVLTAQTEVVTKQGKQPKRTLMQFTKNALPSYRKETLYMLDAHGNTTDDYRLLVQDFYLK